MPNTSLFRLRQRLRSGQAQYKCPIPNTQCPRRHLLQPGEPRQRSGSPMPNAQQLNLKAKV
ncbi:hypothetical protein [Nostoc sp.]|uniref:hypothetical protein n=1 Tax=Nostoc sp. TaxID=1180 RepID=UPI002FF86296